MGQTDSHQYFRLVNCLIKLTLVLLVIIMVALTGFFFYLQRAYFFTNDFLKLVQQTQLTKMTLGNGQVILNSKFSVALVSLAIALNLAMTALAYLIMKRIQRVFVAVKTDAATTISFDNIIKPQLGLLALTVMGTIVAGFLGSIDLEVTSLFTQTALLAVTVILHSQKEINR